MSLVDRIGVPCPASAGTVNAGDPKKKKGMKKLFLALCTAAACAGCAVKSPVAGAVYTDIKDGMAVTGNAGSSRVGTAEVKGYVGVVALGDASIQAAAREAGITRIHHVDYESRSYLGLYSVYTIIVYGD